ncbi:MAG: bifunctional serine/threonine-protein kinase/formylglycine-generating enzyme family protein [Muribaculaceae bacterium]|nr:bifunctional serine/threonine-protein kinase/formylglycine-generating enzyme family protein [Muribaculaceae bacterium]
MQTLLQNSLLQGGKYKIVRHISSGGFGNTYEGVHTMMDTRVAIKEFFPKVFCNRDENTSHIKVATQSNRDLVEKLRKKFIEEAKAIFKMNHSNIVKVYDIFEENGTAYYVMDYIDGNSLADMVNQRGALPEVEAVDYIRQVADALKYVHSLNRLHLDIKPGNVMVDAKGHAVLIDFGASKHYDMESGENTSTLMGVNTKGYAPVEQSTQSFTKFSPATDIYALGATLYKLLTGITPPDANLLMAKEETLEPLPRSNSMSTRNAVLKAMTQIRAERPQTVDAFLALLDSRIAYSIDDEETICDVEEQAYKAEEARRQAVEVRKIKKAEEKTRNIAKKSGSKKAWIWSLVGVIAVVGIIIGVNSNGDISDSISSKQSGGAIQSGTNASYSDGVLNIDSVTYEMVKVQAGTFTMGATPEMKDPGDGEKPTHQVTLTNDYYIGKTEVPQALWKAVMGNNPSDFKGDNLPVESVSWNDCQKFISKLNSLTGQDFRLPTEAEWEFAARGGNNSNHYQYSGSNKLDDVAWYDGNSGDKTHAVATKQPNELGIYDMSGNVWEWCFDWYGNYSGSTQTNPSGPNSGSNRVNRGGGWSYDAGGCRSSLRYYNTPEFSRDCLGLRLVLVP